LFQLFALTDAVRLSSTGGLAYQQQVAHDLQERRKSTPHNLIVIHHDDSNAV
jgi:hypothetical protein